MQTADVIQAVSAVGSLAAAMVGWSAASAARAAARAGNAQALAAQRQVDLALEMASSAAMAAKEAARARADQRAPSLLVAVLPPESEPTLVAGEADIDLLSSETYAKSRAIGSLEDGEDPSGIVWFHGHGYVVNEGDTSALVAADSAVLWSPADDFKSEYMGLPVVSAQVLGQRSQLWCILPPQAVVRYRWAVGRTTHSWIHDVCEDLGAESTRIRILGKSIGQNSVVDTIESEIVGCPITQTSPGRWAVGPDWPRNLSIFTYPAIRSYQPDPE